MIGSIISGASQLINSGLSIHNNERNYAMQKQALDFNQDMATKQFEYQKELNNLQMEREDNAVQRRANDLSLAGLNRLSAAGQSASAGNMVSSSATGGSAQNTAGAEIKLDAQGLMNQAYNAMKMKQDIAQSQAQEKLLEKQAERVQSEIDVNTAKAGNLKRDTEHYTAKEENLKSQNALNDSNRGVNSYRMSNLAKDTDLKDAMIHESHSRTDNNDMDTLKNFFDYNIFRSLGMPTSSDYKQGLKWDAYYGARAAGNYFGSKFGGYSFPSQPKRRY